MRQLLLTLIFLPIITLPSTAPYPTAPACAVHDPTLYHPLWNDTFGCHYDHEHGQNPFTPEVAAAFPGFDLRALIGGVGVGHTNPSSPMENTHKHGGFKWDVTLSHTAGCTAGGGIPTGVNALIVQYHAFGNYAVEFESRVHSAVGLLRQCRAANPTDYGYAFFNQHQDYGQRVSPYQGTILPYPDTPSPSYAAHLSPYFSVDCVGPVIQCRPSRSFVLSRNANASSTWVSRPQAAPIGSTLFAFLFRVRDNYQLRDHLDMDYPFTFVWICSANGGLSYAALSGCRWNNSTTRIHEVHGEIPTAWDNLDGFDLDPRVGRITGESYVTAFGVLNVSCETPGPDCHPIKLLQAFTGKYMSLFSLAAGKASFSKENLPERDICFQANGQAIACDLGGASSAWIGAEN